VPALLTTAADTQPTYRSTQAKDANFNTPEDEAHTSVGRDIIIEEIDLDQDYDSSDGK
jgi:hypothetical protein